MSAFRPPCGPAANQALAADAFNAWWKHLRLDNDPLLGEEAETLALNAWLQGWQHNTIPLEVENQE